MCCTVAVMKVDCFAGLYAGMVPPQCRRRWICVRWSSNSRTGKQETACMTYREVALLVGLAVLAGCAGQQPVLPASRPHMQWWREARYGLKLQFECYPQ